MKRSGFNPVLPFLISAAFAAPSMVHAGCIASDEWIKPVIYSDAPQVTARAQSMLQDLVVQALAHSQAVGAARLLAQAATIEIDAARAARLPRADLLAGAGYARDRYGEAVASRGGFLRGGLSVTVPLYDSGRSAENISWREHLADAARLGEIDAREQVAQQTLSLALERSRYYKQGQVSQQHAQRLTCLVDSLERVVAADSGRRSELDQARKTLLEAELTQTRSETAKRQVELRLQSLTGTDLPRLEGLTTVFSSTPAVATLLAATTNSTTLRQLFAEADAARARSRALAADGKPRIEIGLDGSHRSGPTDSENWQLGVNLVVPLFDPGIRFAADAAARRAEAVGLQAEDAREQRLSRVAYMHAQALSLAQQGLDIDVILEQSARVRQATLAQWQRLGKRSLFDVMSAERDHFSLRIAQVDALHDRQQANVLLWSLGAGIEALMAVESSTGG